MAQLDPDDGTDAVIVTVVDSGHQTGLWDPAVVVPEEDLGV